MTANKDFPHKSGSGLNTVHIKVIDFNVAVKLKDDNEMIYGCTGLKEWSAPETRK